MGDQDFTTTFTVDESAEKVFLAITNVRGWWSEDIEGSTESCNGVFTYRHRDVHRCTIRVMELVPGKKVEWLVLDNYFDFVKDKEEWKNTRVVFEISRTRDKTEVRFTHVGLTRAYECISVCRDAWSFYVNTSLRELIVIGEGRPNRDRTPRV